MVTLSGYRDLLPLQIKTIAEAAFLAASADEPLEKILLELMHWRIVKNTAVT